MKTLLVRASRHGSTMEMGRWSVDRLPWSDATVYGVEEAPGPSEDVAFRTVIPDIEVRWCRNMPGDTEKNRSASRSGKRTCSFVYCMDGGLHVCPAETQTCDGDSRHPRTVPGYSYLFFGCWCQSRACAAGAKTRLMEIRLARRHLLHLLDRHRLARVLWRAEREGRPLTLAAKITPDMDHVLRLMGSCSSCRDTPALFTTAKALELMWLFADAFDKVQDERVNGKDLRAVRRAQTILESRLTDPPPLSELAARVGMSLSKFKSLFPRVCGHPPYAYLRQARMDRAFYLLRTTDMNVTEVALEVGYSSPSRFSRAFAGRFGLNPSLAKRMPSPLR